jgi:hypothetical protein
MSSPFLRYLDILNLFVACIVKDLLIFGLPSKDVYLMTETFQGINSTGSSSFPKK